VRPDQDVNMIWHDDPGLKGIEVAFVFASQDGCGYYVRDGWMAEPDWTLEGRWERTVETPG
jgi:hypothetical protein